MREGLQNRNVTEVTKAPLVPGITRQIIEAAGHPPLVKIVSRAETNQVERRLKRRFAVFAPPFHGLLGHRLQKPVIKIHPLVIRLHAQMSNRASDERTCGRADGSGRASASGGWRR